MDLLGILPHKMWLGTGTAEVIWKLDWTTQDGSLPWLKVGAQMETLPGAPISDIARVEALLQEEVHQENLEEAICLLMV